MSEEKTLKYPNFLILGAGKSGTTSLFHYLNQHPQVYMSPIKEPDFFAVEGEKEVSPEEDPEGLYHYPWAVRDLEGYKNLYKDVSDEIAVGESSTMYLYKPKAPANIKKYVPHAKMIAIFRDPVSRLYSRYLHLAREDRLPTENFSDCLDKTSIWWRRDDLVQEGFFYKHLSRYFEMFDRKQFKIFLYEDLRKKPEEVMKEIYQFLGVDDSYKPNMDVRFNVSGVVKNRFLNRFIGQDSIFKKSIGRITPGLWSKLSGSMLMQKMVGNLRAKNLGRPEIDQEVKRKLVEEVYKDDILKFQELINRDLTSWLKTY